MGEMDIRKSFLFSIGIHVLLVLIFSLMLLNNHVQKTIEPVVVEIQSESASLAKGVPDSLLEPIPEKAPAMRERKTRPQEKTAVPDKTMPARQPAVVPESASKKPTPVRPSTSEIAKTKPREITPDQVNADDRLDPMMSRETGPSSAPASDALSDSIDEALAADNPEGTGVNPVTKGDPLGDAQWSDRPRKTLFFPDIESKIPTQYRKKGMGYSITARIRFDKNGLATQVDIISSSGEAAIDSLFYAELRKIRVEAVTSDRTDEITKTFTISVK